MKSRTSSGTITSFDLSRSWNSQWLIAALRTEVEKAIEEIRAKDSRLFDPQDLEHQALFYLTTFAPGDITRESIIEVVHQQHALVIRRVHAAASQDELRHLFRGLGGQHRDLNVSSRLKMKKVGTKLFAVGDGVSLEVEFRKIEDSRMVSLFTGAFHYVHSARQEGDAFGYYFKGDTYPWAIETVEAGSLARGHKREALLAHGFDPDKTVELTRLYMLPGSPRNAISMLDGLVADYYRSRGFEAMFTCTMPAYSKTKSSTISGGMNKVLCIRDLEHYFAKVEIEGMTCWQQVTRRWLESGTYDAEIRKSHPAFGLLPVVDVFMELNSPSGQVLPALKQNNSAMCFSLLPSLTPVTT